jgi:xanthine dehydrogenase YagS FAD-binding subunit
MMAEAARQAASGANPLPMTGYKLDLLQGVVHDVLERLAV